MAKCKVCEKEIKNLEVHIKTTHKMSQEEYETYEAPEPKNIKDSATLKERKEDIFGKEEDMLLSEFLEQHDITRDELSNVVKRYKEGAAIPVTQMQERLAKIANTDAEELKDKDEVETRSLAIAEALVKNYNFEVVAVVTGPPKTWHLKKK